MEHTKTIREVNHELYIAPTTPILDMLARTVSVTRRYQKIMVSVSGGSDSDIVVDVIDRMGAKGKATFVFFNTGLEYDATKRHLADMEEKYGIKIQEVPPVLPIPACCRRYGVPFWSKRVSEMIYRLQRHGFQWEDEPFGVLYNRYPKCKAALRWWCNEWPRKENGAVSELNIEYSPYLKEYMVKNHPPKISAKCCEKAKKEPARKYFDDHGFDLNCTGIRKAEKGQRAIAFKSCYTEACMGDTASFRPLFWLTDSDKQDYKEHYGIVNSDCYEVWGMKRTGCCGCPYGKEFEQELELMRRFEPKLYKAAVNIFGESYEYTRGYLRFRKEMREAIDLD